MRIAKIKSKEKAERNKLRLEHLKRELVTKSLYLTEKEEVFSNFLTSLEGVYKLESYEIKESLKQLIRQMSSANSYEHDWAEFEKWFTQIHADFFNSLRNAFPDLTQRELKVCALLRLNMVTKDIANLMNIQPATIEIYRHRIRKKVNLDPKENLANFLSKY